jgi:phage baseplate assembly protein W
MAIKRNTRNFSDLNMLFTASSATGDITKKVDEEAIKTSIRNLISTKNYERPFHPEIGCQLFALLFENFTSVTAQVIKKTIFDTINKFEPRVSILDVMLSESEDTNNLDVSITFSILNNERPVILNTTIQRAR